MKNIKQEIILKVAMYVVGAIVVGGAIKWVVNAGTRHRQRLMQEFAGFDPNYYRNHTYTISHSRAKALADKAYNAVGVFNDNEEMMISVLLEAGTRANLSLVSHYFNIRHNESLGGWYADYMDRRTETKDVMKALKKISR